MPVQMPPILIQQGRPTSVQSLPKLKFPKILSRTGSKHSDSTLPLSSNISPTSPVSTAPTSFSSNTSPFRSQLSPDLRFRKDWRLGISVHHPGRLDTSLPPIVEHDVRPYQDQFLDTPSPIAPSVETIEKVAAVKTFFELHFDNLLFADHSPRSLRRREFEQKLKEVSLTTDQAALARQHWFQSENAYTRELRVFRAGSEARRNVRGAMAQYEPVRVLGKGSFGIVNLVTERDDTARLTADDLPDSTGERRQSSCKKPTRGTRRSEFFAMKIIRKCDMLRDCQEAHLRAERDFLVGSEGSSWVVPLVTAFQDSVNLYLVMEYMAGGDFMGFLLREDVLDEDTAR
ncbi:Pkinase-domain-containing protein [Myriangium duriaei CBS 260.36]|uniref:non-specific serine/threonine protein kinase n=1 Tax=Myriangium duriaei CBS 260.36 TaxID=1168546 RepID=A0A9P4J4Y4_9PEZI|nr:Pkinase-domain-containing protein [Myriangium duriaei CBS 260.36]